MAFYEGRDYRLVEELMDRCMSGEASQVSAYLDRRVDNARLLLERGAGSTIYRKDRWGRTPIDLARGQPRMIALLRKYFTIIVRKYVIGGNAEHPSRNRMKHLAPQMASFLIPDPILI